MDYRLAFSERPAGVQLGQLDSFSRQAIVGTYVYPPGSGTDLSIPSLILGRRVSESRADRVAEFLVRVNGGEQAVDWGWQPTVFSRARESGCHVGVVGWYFPYCRIFGGSLARCSWHPAGLSAVRGGRRVTIREGLIDSIVQLVDSIPYRNRLRLPQLFSRLGLETRTAEARVNLNDYQEILRESLELVSEPKIQFVFAHWPVPHEPAIYRAASQELSPDGSGMYFDNLALVDRTLAEIRMTMKRAGLWDNTAILITSDHSWRDAAGWDGKLDKRVPFLLKLPGQEKGVEFARPFNTILIHDLVLELLGGRFSDQDEVPAWNTIRAET